MLCGQGAEFWILSLAMHMQIITLEMINFMEHMHSSEALSGIAVQVWSRKAQCRVREGYPHNRILSHMNPFHAFTAHFFKIML